MFFIGGINTIFPFVLYISLIWICVVIGYGNKLKGIVQSADVHCQFTKSADIQESEKDLFIEAEAKDPYTKSDNNIKPYVRPEPLTGFQPITRIKSTVYSNNKLVLSSKAPSSDRGPPAA